MIIECPQQFCKLFWWISINTLFYSLTLKYTHPSLKDVSEIGHKLTVEWFNVGCPKILLKTKKLPLITLFVCLDVKLIWCKTLFVGHRKVVCWGLSVWRVSCRCKLGQNKTKSFKITAGGADIRQALISDFFIGKLSIKDKDNRVGKSQPCRSEN